MQPETRICERCHAAYTITFVRQSKRRFCSVKCAALSRPTTDQAARFWAKCEQSEPEYCWRWCASKQRNGYGVFFYNNKLDRAHRVAWMLTNGPIPDGMLVMHTCDNRECVNPTHLKTGTDYDNVQDMVSKGRHGEGKLSREAAQAIREDGRRHRVIAAEYGVSRPLISAIKRGDAWRETR
jgi:hypothetical protein